MAEKEQEAGRSSQAGVACAWSLWGVEPVRCYSAIDLECEEESGGMTA